MLYPLTSSAPIHKMGLRRRPEMLETSERLFRILTVIALLLCAQHFTFAQQTDRSGKLEIYGQGYTYGREGQVGDVEWEWSGGLDLGAGIGFHLNQFFYLHLDTWYGTHEVTFTVNNIKVSGEGDIFALHLNGDVYLFNERITPLVSGGVGLVNFSPEGLHHDATSTRLGFGLRWEIQNLCVLTGMYQILWVKLMPDWESTTFTGFRMTLGFLL